MADASNSIAVLLGQTSRKIVYKIEEKGQCCSFTHMTFLSAEPRASRVGISDRSPG